MLMRQGIRYFKSSKHMVGWEEALNRFEGVKHGIDAVFKVEGKRSGVSMAYFVGGVQGYCSGPVLSLPKAASVDEIVELGVQETIRQQIGWKYAFGETGGGGACVVVGGEDEDADNIGLDVAEAVSMLRGAMLVQPWNLSSDTMEVYRDTCRFGLGRSLDVSTWGMAAAAGIVASLEGVLEGKEVRESRVGVVGVGGSAMEYVIRMLCDSGALVSVSARSLSCMARLRKECLHPGMKLVEGGMGSNIDMDADVLLVGDGALDSEWKQWAPRIRADKVLDVVGLGALSKSLIESRNIPVIPSSHHFVTAVCTNLDAGSLPLISNGASVLLRDPAFTALLDRQEPHSCYNISKAHTRKTPLPPFPPKPPSIDRHTLLRASLVEEQPWLNSTPSDSSTHLLEPRTKPFQQNSQPLENQTSTEDLVEQLYEGYMPGSRTPRIQKDGRGKPSTRLRRHHREDY